jgi:hypothetical protein
MADPSLLLWRKYINTAVAEAKKTRFGVQTDAAILARWWIADHNPSQNDKDEWERSFAAACSWLDLDAAKERQKLLQEIDDALRVAAWSWTQKVMFARRAMVLTCAGIAWPIGSQLVLPLVSYEDYEDIAGIDHGDQYALYDRIEE